MPINWTADEFEKHTGRIPENDDLDRCNCPDAGKIGHWACGICKEHNTPVFMCDICFPKSHKGLQRL